MIFLEVDDIEECADELLSKGLHDKYKYVRFTEIKQFNWGENYLCTTHQEYCGIFVNSTRKERKPAGSNR